MTHICSICHFITVSTYINTHTHKCTSSSQSVSAVVEWITGCWGGGVGGCGRYRTAISWRDSLFFCSTHTENVKYSQAAGSQLAHCGNAVRMGSVTCLSLRNISHVHRSHFWGRGEEEEGGSSPGLRIIHKLTRRIGLGIHIKMVNLFIRNDEKASFGKKPD